MTAAAGFKRLGIAIVAVVALGLAAVAASSWLISADSAREAVKAQIRLATGLDPVIRGPVTVSMFPPDTVELADVVLAESDRPALAADKLTAHLRLLPLLVGRIDISSISLLRPRIALAFEPGGHSNWAALIDALARALKPNADRAALSLSEIRIEDGIIHIDEPGRELAENLTKVDISLAWPSIAKTFGATGRFTWRGEPFEASLAIGDFYPALIGEPSGLKFRVAGAPFKLAFDGTTSNRPSLKIDGTLAADAPSLRNALRWMGHQPPPGGGLGRLALKAQANAVSGTLALSNVNIEIDGNAAEGALTYASEDRRIVKGTLAVEGLDLTPYLSTFQLSAANEREWDKMPITLDALDGIDVDLRLSAARVTMGNAKLGRTAVAANLHGGRLTLTIGESQAFGGSITGSLALARLQRGADVKSQMQFVNVDLDACLGELFGIRRIEGKGNLGYAIEASGTSVDAITRTLSGTATLTATNGALTGLDIEQLLRRLERRPLSGAGDFRSGRTPYQRLKVALTISQGTATVEDVLLEGSALRLVLAGSASIPGRDVDLRGTAHLVAGGSDATGSFELPFVVQGRWDDPLMLPDPQILIRRSGAAAPLLDAVRGRSARDTVRSAIDRLTGGPSPRSVPGGAQP